MKRFMLFLALLLTTATMMAETLREFEIDRFTYVILSPTEVAIHCNNENITHAKIPSIVTYNDTVYSVTSIGEYAFYDCRSLTSITIPNSVTSIGGSAFDGCSGLTSITIPNSVTEIRSYAFALCHSLTSITIPNSVTSIGYRAFQECSSLTTVTIPNSVTCIGDSAFWDCSSLTSITIPNSVTSITLGIFPEETEIIYEE